MKNKDNKFDKATENITYFNSNNKLRIHYIVVDMFTKTQHSLHLFPPGGVMRAGGWLSTGHSDPCTLSAQWTLHSAQCTPGLAQCTECTVQSAPLLLFNYYSTGWLIITGSVL